MTEEEARKKRCPVACGRIVAYQQSDRHSWHIVNCIASECMAFRWKVAPGESDPNWDGYVVPSGYCGLAGQP